MGYLNTYLKGEFEELDYMSLKSYYVEIIASDCKEYLGNPSQAKFASDREVELLMPLFMNWFALETIEWLYHKRGELPTIDKSASEYMGPSETSEFPKRRAPLIPRREK